MKIFVSTGDTSAEQHLIPFIRAAQAARPELTFHALGSQILRDAGIETVIDSTPIKVMGLVAILRHIPVGYRIFHQALDWIGTNRPEAVILSDYSGFNLRLARAVKEKYPKIPVVYYITPQVWAWRRGRVDAMRRYVDHCLCILPFEEAWFRERGVSAEYVGNPVMDAVRNADPRAAKKLLGLADHTRLITVFPGSRRKELQYIFRPMMHAVEILSMDMDDLAFAVAAAPGFTRCDLEKYCRIPGHVPVLEGHNLELLAGSHFCMAKSGTTTLEAALLGCPMLVAYRGDWLSAQIALTLMRWHHMRFISLPNIIADKSIVPEFLQDMCNGPELARISRLMLLDWELYDQMRDDLHKLRTVIGEEPSAERTARALLRFLDQRHGNAAN